MFIQDVPWSKAFYERVFDAQPAYEDENAVAFKFENTVVNLLRASEARDLIGPAAVADRTAGSRFQLTVWVDDTDAVCAELSERGVELLNGPIDRDGAFARRPSPIPTATSGKWRRKSGTRPRRPRRPSDRPLRACSSRSRSAAARSGSRARDSALPVPVCP
jgi:catechol 2,3-dioxygenase-like lactoylglutathione lyase family enzyme